MTNARDEYRLTEIWLEAVLVIGVEIMLGRSLEQVRWYVLHFLSINGVKTNKEVRARVNRLLDVAQETAINHQFDLAPLALIGRACYDARVSQALSRLF